MSLEELFKSMPCVQTKVLPCGAAQFTDANGETITISAADRVVLSQDEPVKGVCSGSWQRCNEALAANEVIPFKVVDPITVKKCQCSTCDPNTPPLAKYSYEEFDLGGES